MSLVSEINMCNNSGCMTAEQIKIFKAMSPADKLNLAASFYAASRDLKAASLRALRPGISEKEVQSKTREFFLYAAN